MKRKLSRRCFLSKFAAGAAGLLILRDSQSVRGVPANERINVALVGIGGFCWIWLSQDDESFPPDGLWYGLGFLGLLAFLLAAAGGYALYMPLIKLMGSIGQ